MPGNVENKRFKGCSINLRKQKERLSLALFSHYFGNGRYSKKENDLGE
jgi:hypothetical protein